MARLRKRKESKVVNEAIRETGGMRLWRIEYTLEGRVVFAVMSPHLEADFPGFTAYTDIVMGTFIAQPALTDIETHIRDNESLSVLIKENWRITDKRGILIQDIDLYFPHINVAYDIITPASLIELGQGRVKTPCEQLTDFPGHLYYAIITDYHERRGIITNCGGLLSIIEEVRRWNIPREETLSYAGLGRADRHIEFRNEIQAIAREFNFTNADGNIFLNIQAFNQVFEQKISGLRDSNGFPLLW